MYTTGYQKILEDTRKEAEHCLSEIQQLQDINIAVKHSELFHKMLHLLSKYETVQMLESVLPAALNTQDSSNPDMVNYDAVIEIQSLTQEEINQSNEQIKIVSRETSEPEVQHTPSSEAIHKFRIPKIRHDDTTSSQTAAPRIQENTGTNSTITSASEPKRNSIFALSLNDQFLFSRTLFDNKPELLQECLTKINSMNNADDCKVYLSKLYHEKNWKKHDEEAQHLWSLTEAYFKNEKL